MGGEEEGGGHKDLGKEWEEHRGGANGEVDLAGSRQTVENSDREAVGSRDRCRVRQRHGGVGVGVRKDGETALESPGGQRQGRQRHMEIEKRTQGEIEPRIDREPQQEIQSHRDTERQRERDTAPERQTLKSALRVPARRRNTHTQPARARRSEAGARPGLGAARGGLRHLGPLPWSYHSP